MGLAGQTLLLAGVTYDLSFSPLRVQGLPGNLLRGRDLRRGDAAPGTKAWRLEMGRS